MGYAIITMTHFSFREHHILKILSQFEIQKGPLDFYSANYFRANKAIGSKDRKYISDTLYGMMRWRGLLEHLCKQKPTWEECLQIFQKMDPKNYIDTEVIPLHVRVSFPQNYFQILSSSLGESRAVEFCLASNESAPTTIRANLLKISRDELVKKWEKTYDISPTLISPNGITFHKKINFFVTEEFKEGLFEVQDEASQLIASLVSPHPKDRILDYCAGSGGKTLAIAPHMQGRGQIYLHDIRPSVLAEAKKRLARAGIQNAQVISSDSTDKKNALKGQFDWVLVDAPCSGSGTLRRNPDMKWRFDPAMINTLIRDQRTIFEEALFFLRPGGKIVYATCSVLPQENEDQIKFFMEKHHLQTVGTPFHSLPKSKQMDGFFGAVLKHS